MIILLLLLTFSLRFYGINWDQGFHLHPDERMIIMVADRIRLPRTPSEWNLVFTPESSLNPKFFAYGSFPIYLLKAVSWIFGMDNYDERLTVGRLISAVFDLGTVFLVFLIGKCVIPTQLRRYVGGAEGSSINRLQNPKSWKIPRSGFAGLGMTLSNNCIFPLFAAFFYAASVLSIQSSHFFISDIPLTFLTTLVLYLSIRFIGLGKIKHILNTKYLILNTLIGIALGLSLATKITAILLIIPVFLALLIRLMRFRNIKSLLVSLLIIAFFSSLTFTITMPYAIFDFKTFRANNLEQSQMRVNPFVFPFTLQYVNTIPYWYFVKNLILWGMGLPLGLIAVTGTIYIIISWLTKIKQFVKKKKLFPPWDSLSILLIFFIVYFAFMGKSAVKFMRYLLPVYPLFCLFGSLFLFQLKTLVIPSEPRLWRGKSRNLIPTKLLKVGRSLHASDVTSELGRDDKRSSFLTLLILLLCTLWPLSFINIYAKPHTRIAASEWIYKNIPEGSSLAVEHWDDQLPLLLPNIQKTYQYLELPLYEADTESKWKNINQKLKEADYIIIASNRLYVPLMRLTDCEKLPPGRCYPLTAKYYQDLFAEKLDFVKAAEFTSYPSFSLFPLSSLSPLLTFNDDSADESFTVYDHPKALIFKKKLDRSQTF